MDRFELMSWKVVAPGCVWMLASLGVAWALSGGQSTPYTIPLLAMLRWVPIAMFSWGAVLLVHAFYRLRQFEQGKGLHCGCGGLLGAERHGRYGPYRKCFACGRNVGRRFYG